MPVYDCRQEAREVPDIVFVVCVEVDFIHFLFGVRARARLPVRRARDQVHGIPNPTFAIM
jgi:hypothetical protein